MWLIVVTCRFSFRENSKASDASYWSLQPEHSWELTPPRCTRSAGQWAVLEVELGYHVSSDHILGRVLQAPDCPALKVSCCRRRVNIPNLLSSCVLLRIISDRFTLHDISVLVPKDMFHKQQASLTFRYSAYSPYSENTHFCSFFTKQGTPKPQSRGDLGHFTFNFLSFQLTNIVCSVLKNYLVLGTWMNFF